MPLKFQETCRNKTWKPFCAPFVSIEITGVLDISEILDKQPVHHRFLQSLVLALKLTLRITLVKFMRFSNIEMVRRNTRWDRVVTIIWIYATDKPGKFLRKDLFCCWPQSQRQCDPGCRYCLSNQERTCREDVTECWAGNRGTVSFNSLYRFLLYLGPVKVRPATVEEKIEFSFESWCPTGDLFYLIFWLMNGFAFSVPIFLSIWLDRMCICNICLCPMTFIFLFIHKNNMI